MLRTSRSTQQGHMRRYYSTADMPQAILLPEQANLIFRVTGDVVSGSTWPDQSGHSRDLSLSGSPVFEAVDGRNCVTFNGSTTLATCDGFLDRSGDYSFYVIVKTGPNSDYLDENDMLGQSNDNRMQFRFSNGQQQYEPYLGGMFNGGYVSANSWYRAGLSSISGSVKLYLNGSQSGTGSYTGSGIADTFGVGCFPTSGASFEGQIFEASVWDVGLSSADFGTLDSIFGF